MFLETNQTGILSAVRLSIYRTTQLRQVQPKPIRLCLNLKSFVLFENTRQKNSFLYEKAFDFSQLKCSRTDLGKI